MAGLQRCAHVSAPDGAGGAGVLGHRRRQADHPAPRTRAAIQNRPSAPARAYPNARRPPRAPPREIKQAGRAKPRAHLGLRETRGGSGIRESVRSGTFSYGLIRACGASRAMPLSGSNHGLVRGIDGSISQHHTACDLDLFGLLAAPTVCAAPSRRQLGTDSLGGRGRQAVWHLADPGLVCADQLAPARKRRPPPSQCRALTDRDHSDAAPPPPPEIKQADRARPAAHQSLRNTPGGSETRPRSASGRPEPVQLREGERSVEVLDVVSDVEDEASLLAAVFGTA